MIEVVVPAEAIQYLGIVQALLWFIGAACLGLAVVCLSILLGGD